MHHLASTNSLGKAPWTWINNALRWLYYVSTYNVVRYPTAALPRAYRLTLGSRFGTKPVWVFTVLPSLPISQCLLHQSRAQCLENSHVQERRSESFQLVPSFGQCLPLLFTVPRSLLYKTASWEQRLLAGL